MKIVYLFREANSVQIPFIGYSDSTCKQLIKLGGVWNGGYRGFVFQQKINIQEIKKLFDIVCEVSEKNQQVQYNGFNQQRLKEEINFSAQVKERKIELNQKLFIPFIEKKLPEKLSEQLVHKLEAELRSRKFSAQTQYAYIYYNKLLCRTLQKTPEEICPDDITEFLAIMEKKRGYSASSINLAISAVKFLFKNVLKDNSIKEQKRPNRNQNLPMILSSDEIIKILITEKNPKHRLLLMLAYSSGLRVSEVVSLKKEHIDFSRQVIFIDQGKGRKDRYTMLSEKAAGFLRDYYKQFEIEKWVFPGQSGKKHLSIRSAQHVFDKAVRKAGIIKKISIHGLRHAFATHLLENGTDIRYIQDLLGHTSIRTTERYTQVARRSVLKIKSPLDDIL